MAQRVQKTETNDRTQNETDRAVLDNVMNINRMRQLRREIGIIADRSRSHKLINQEAYGNYKNLAHGNEDVQITLDFLESIRNSAREHEKFAERIHGHIAGARQKKVASAKDEEFLMSELILNNIDFLQDPIQVESIILGKIQRMNKDKELYDKIASDKRVVNVGYVKIDAHTRVDVPSEEEFLEMKVPERRDLLKQLEDALKKPVKNSEVVGEADRKKMVKEYASLLEEAQGAKLIGSKTAERFMDGFSKVSNEEKAYWIAEFPSQMQRYEELWEDAESTLSEVPLKRLQSLQESMGYAELFAEFGRLEKFEGKELETQYSKELAAYKEQGVIGDHTMKKFIVWMAAQDLKDKKEALGMLHQEMARYEELWDKINKLPSRQRSVLEAEIDNWGYTELDQEYRKISEGKEASISKSAALRPVRSSAIRQAIIETEEDLRERGSDKRRTFANRVSEMFWRDKNDSFADSVLKTRVESERKRKLEISQREVQDSTEAEEEIADEKAMNAVQLNPEHHLGLEVKLEEELDEVTDEELEELADEDHGINVIAQEGFREIETNDERTTQVVINEERGLDRLFREDSMYRYRDTDGGGDDEMGFAVKKTDGGIIELDPIEAKALEDYLVETEEAA